LIELTTPFVAAFLRVSTFFSMLFMTWFFERQKQYNRYAVVTVNPIKFQSRWLGTE